MNVDLTDRLRCSQAKDVHQAFRIAGKDLVRLYSVMRNCYSSATLSAE